MLVHADDLGRLNNLEAIRRRAHARFQDSTPADEQHTRIGMLVEERDSTIDRSLRIVVAGHRVNGDGHKVSHSGG
jgi:hypothetical protein